jgi:hypothetical protein
MGGSEPAAAVLTRNLMAVMAASRLIAAGQHSNDACLRARHQLENDLNLRHVLVEDYLAAARAMEDAGLPLHAETLRLIADTDAELRAARQRWQARQTARPESPAEHAAARRIAAGLILAAEPYQEGIDGCYYGLSRLRRDLPGPSGAGVTVMTSARRPQLVAGFRDLDAAREWRLDRTRRAPVPLSGCSTGPGCRVSREESLLAGLLRRPAGELAVRNVSELTWTSDLRAEIFLAWQTTAPDRWRGPAPEAVAEALERRMLRAPDDLTGPAADLAMAYLARLHATAVPAGRFLAAARHVRTEDQAAAACARDADVVFEELARRWPQPPDQRPLRAPPRPAAGPGGLTPGH